MKLGTHSKHERRLRAPCARAPLSAAVWSRSGSYAPAQSVLLPGVRTLRCHISGIFYSALVATSGLTVMRLLWPWLDLTSRAPFRAAQPSSSPGQAVLQCLSHALDQPVARQVSGLDQTAGLAALRLLAPCARSASVQAAPTRPHLLECCSLPPCFGR